MAALGLVEGVHLFCAMDPSGRLAKPWDLSQSNSFKCLKKTCRMTKETS